MADARYRRALEDLRAGRYSAAATALDAMVRRDPRSAEAWANLGAARRALGQVEAAVAAFRTAAALAPDEPAPWCALSVVDPDPAAAVAAARRAVFLAPAPRTRVLLLVALTRANATGEAIRLARAMLAEDTRDGRLWLALGNLLAGEGRSADAVGAWAAAVGAPGGEAAWAPLGDAVAAGAALPAGRRDLLMALATRPEIDPARIERPLRLALEAIPGVANALADPTAPVDGFAAQLLADPVFRPWATRTLAAHPRWERLLVRLVAWAADHPGAPGVDALAERAWNAENVWETPFALLFATTVLAEEARLAAALPDLGRTDDAISAAVRDQYEESPYPRLVTVARRPVGPLADHLARMLGYPVEIPGPRPIPVLVAGCGTGQHALLAASRASDVDVLGVDLSRASLGRAARRAHELAVPNVRFNVADLLALRDVGPFAVIESVGVLHHLADPAAGVRALANLLVPGGLFLVGLYSARGRAEVPIGRDLVADLSPDAAGIREARRRILALPEDHPAHVLAWSPDFSSASGTRDLLFHPSERRYSAIEVRDLLTGAGLEILGIQTANPEARGWYRDRWPDDARQADLLRWDAVEAEHPRLFAGMFLVWTRKP